MDADFNEWNEEDPFKNYDFDTDSLVKKYHIISDKVSEIEDYGIYSYFKYCDTYKVIKMVADIHSESYIINTAGNDTEHHFGMLVHNRLLFGKSNCYMGSFGDEINVFSESKLTPGQYHLLIGVFNELKMYYLETNRNKKIAFIGSAFGDEFDSFKDCSNIDELIEKLTELKKSSELEQDNSFSSGPELFI